MAKRLPIYGSRLRFLQVPGFVLGAIVSLTLDLLHTKNTAVEPSCFLYAVLASLDFNTFILRTESRSCMEFYTSCYSFQNPTLETSFRNKTLQFIHLFIVQAGIRESSPT